MSFDRLGRYEIIEDLGRGAMGVVYRARDPLIDRTVAIKTIACTGLSRDEVETFERRFFREAQSAGRLNHPNIVTIHEVGRDGDLAYMVMEFLHGSTLRSILDSGLVLTEEQVIDIAVQVADGLAFAHANGVVHRDIKPANIVVLANGTVKIADFGVALMPTGSATLVGTVFGSPKYMSPEQVAGKAVDGRSDIFALGAVLHEMLTGVPPFQGDDLAAILHAVIHTTPPPPSARRRKLHPGFDRIVATAMAKDPAQRYQTADEMAADLAACGQEGADPRTQDDPLLAASHEPPGLAGRVGIFGTIAAIAVITAVLVVAYAAWLRPGKEATPATAALPAPALKAPVVAQAPAPEPQPSGTVNTTEVLPPPPKAEAPAKAVAPPKPTAVKNATTPPKSTPVKKAAAPRKTTAAKKTATPPKATAAKKAVAPTKAAAPAAPAAPARPAASPGPDWARMHQELADCGRFNVFCHEKVRWRYCADHWGKVPECPQGATRRSAR